MIMKDGKEGRVDKRKVVCYTTFMMSYFLLFHPHHKVIRLYIAEILYYNEDLDEWECPDYDQYSNIAAYDTAGWTLVF